MSLTHSNRRSSSGTLERPQQPLIDQLPDRDYAAVVVGAGPAGAFAAMGLAERGHEVLLIDQHRFPREKVCGDVLLFDAIDALARVGLLEKVKEHGLVLPAATIYSPSQYHFDVPGNYLTIKRRKLDAIVAFAAARAGAVFAAGLVAGVVQVEPDRFELSFTGSQSKIRARHLVLATGSQVTLGARVGLVTRDDPSAVAIRKYIRSDYQLEEMILSYDRSLIPGYAWIIPMGNGEYNVGCGTFFKKGSHSYGGLKKTLARFLEEFPIGREIMAGASAQSRIGGAALRCGLDGAGACSPEGIVAVGETIGATFPFTGEGIGKAMETGEKAAEVIADALTTGKRARLASYSAWLEDDLRPRYRGYQFAERWLSKPWLNDFTAKRIQRSPMLQKQFKEFVSESGDPRRVYAVLTLIRSFFS